MSVHSKFIIAHASYTVATGVDGENPANTVALIGIFKSAATRHGFGLTTGTIWGGPGVMQIVPRHEVTFETFREFLDDVATACGKAVFLAPALDRKGVDFMQHPEKTVASSVRDDAILVGMPKL